MESKMDLILQESERRMIEKMANMENRTASKLGELNDKISRIESMDTNIEGNDARIATFTNVINEQMDIITNRLDVNLDLIRENTERLNTVSQARNTCPNEERVTNVEGNLDQVGQDQRNFSLIITRLNLDFQNLNGIIGFCRDILGIFIDPNKLSEVLKLGMSRQGKTITKAVFFSVGTRLRVYQVQVAMRGQPNGIYLNEDLTKGRECLCYMTRLFKDKSVAKNWTFLGKIYVKRTTEGEVMEIKRKEDLVPLDTKGTLRALNLL